jgi:probable phosphoglycerate mutase
VVGTGVRSWEPRTGAPTRLILVRHGETALNAHGRYSGRGDVPLSDRGRAQARATADRLAGLSGSAGPAGSAGSVGAAGSAGAGAAVGSVAAVVSSPLSRATGTARILAAALGNPSVSTEPDLVECDFGVWEGRTFAEVREGWPDELTAWLASPAVAPPGGESFEQVSVRVRVVLDRLRAKYPEQTVVLVSHVTPIKLILRDALAAGDDFLHRLYLDPAGVSIVDSWADGGIAVRTVNDTAHLAAIAAASQ